MTNQAFDFDTISDYALKIASGGNIRLQNLTDMTPAQVRPQDVKLTAVIFLGPPEFAGV